MPVTLRVAIVGVGPAGLAATIHLRRLDHVQLSVFDQARELREVGGGITVKEHAWRLLEDLGAATSLEEYLQRGKAGAIAAEHRDGFTGEILAQAYQTTDVTKPPRSRLQRHRLQRALLDQIPPGVINLSKKIIEISESDQGVHLSFADGSNAGPFDLVIGADGIRSVVRQYAFPDYKTFYTGMVSYRALVPEERLDHIPGIPDHSVWWHGTTTSLYTCRLTGGYMDLATRRRETEENGAKVSWGQPANAQTVQGKKEEFGATVRAVFEAVDSWKEFALFSGPRLPSVIHHGRIVVIGDSAHPLNGAFGSGASFALEDAQTLALAISHAAEKEIPLARTLELYNSVRMARYNDLYDLLATIDNIAKKSYLKGKNAANTTRHFWDIGDEDSIIYTYDVKDGWGRILAEQGGVSPPVAAAVEISNA